MTNSQISTLSKQSSDSYAILRTYRRIVLLTEGLSTPFFAKIAMSLLRYRRSDVIAVLDAGEIDKCAQDIFGIGDTTPIESSLDGLNADALFLGTTSLGGKLPESWRPIILDALAKGIDVVSGMHEFLSEDQEYSLSAKKNNCRLIDVRRNNEKSLSTGEGFRSGCLRIHTVGQDCSLGKMVTSLEVQLELTQRGIDAQFVATGQTGIMVSGDGVPIDCVVSDFVNGAAEALVRRNDHHDVLIIEGQGSISHPSFSAVTLGLLHGCLPDGLIYCYELGRTAVKGMGNVTLLPHRRLIEAYEAMASLRQVCPVIGIAMNSRHVSLTVANEEREKMQNEFGLPVCDVYRHGASSLANAVIDLKLKLNK